MSRQLVAYKRDRATMEQDSDSDNDVTMSSELPPGHFFCSYRASKQVALQRQRREIKLTNKWKFIYQSQGDTSSHNSKYYGDGLCCRQMSMYFLRHHWRRSDKSYDKVLTSKAAIDTTSLPLNLFDKQRWEYHGDRYIFNTIAGSGLGAAIGYGCDELRVMDKRFFLLASENHIMAIAVECQGSEKLVVKFYDPNKSGCHLRAVCYDLKQVRSLRLDHFLSMENIEDYFPKVKSLTLIQYVDPWAVNASPAGGQLHNVAVYGNNKSDYLYFSIIYARLESMLLMMQRIIDTSAAIISSKQKAQLLRAVDDASMLAMHRLVHEGHPDVLLAYMQAVVSVPSSVLSEAIKISLLNAGAGERPPVLFDMVDHGNAEMVARYIDFVLAAPVEQLSHEAKQALLLSEYRGMPAIVYAMLQGDSDFVDCYAAKIVAANAGQLSAKIKAYLLNPIYRKGMSAITAAGALAEWTVLQRYHRLIARHCTEALPEEQRTISAEAITAHIDWVASLHKTAFTMNKRRDFLLLKDSGGFPIMFDWVNVGDNATIAAYITGVLSLPDKVLSLPKRMACVVGRYSGHPSIHQALEQGKLEFALTYARAIMAIPAEKLSSSQKWQMLNPKLASGETALMWGAAHAKPEVMAAYRQLIGSCKPRSRVRMHAAISLMPPKPAAAEIDDDVSDMGMGLPVCAIM